MQQVSIEDGAGEAPGAGAAEDFRDETAGEASISVGGEDKEAFDLAGEGIEGGSPEGDAGGGEERAGGVFFAGGQRCDLEGGEEGGLG